MASRWEKMKRSVFPAKTTIYAMAPTQKVRILAGQVTPPPPAYGIIKEKNAAPPVLQEVFSEESEVTSAVKPNFFDRLTKAAGSPVVFFVVMVLVGLWVLWGIVDGTTDTWQIIIQNVSSIQVYLTDILLIRQQSNASQSMLTTLAELQSRNQHCERMLGQIPNCQWMETHKDPPKQLMLNGRPIEDEVEESLFMVTGRPSRFAYVWEKMCHTTAKAIGSIWAFAFYWVGIFAWVGIGPIFKFSDTWQLYVNTATAVSLTITSVFLQNIEQSQEDKLEQCLHYALKIDAEVEYRLRELTEDAKPNPIFEIPPRKRHEITREIILTIAVFIVWFAVGPVLEFGDNWFLIIGTFTGLVGFIDGFILRNLYMRGEASAAVQFRALQDPDIRLLERLNVPVPRNLAIRRPMPVRISIWIGDACGSQWASVGSVLFVVALLVTATIMLWSEAGQLLCNTSTMIIEGFLLLVLIQTHNISNEERGLDFNGLLKRRLLLNSYVHAIEFDN